jgi:hypothetical protein
MDEDATTNWTKRCLVKVKGPLEKFPRANSWIECGLPEKVEGEFSLWQKKVPKVRGKCGIPSSRLCMDEDATTNQTRRCLVKVKRPLEKFPCTNPWIEHGLPEKVEGEFSLWQKKVPKVQGKCGIDAGQYCKEVVLERVNSVFSPVAAMHIRQDKLELGVLHDGDGFLVCRTGLVVEDLEVN